MKVVLLKDVKGLGEIGKVLEVARGYARNYLLPRKLAKFASSWELAEIRTKEAKTEKQSQKAKNLSKTLAAELSGQAFEFVLPADSAGHLYAGLKESEIFAKIREQATAQLKQ
jgi:large subunit ribosomal protein L9